MVRHRDDFHRRHWLRHRHSRPPRAGHGARPWHARASDADRRVDVAGLFGDAIPVRADRGRAWRPVRTAAGAARRARRLRHRLSADGLCADNQLAVPRPPARRCVRRLLRPGDGGDGGRLDRRGPRTHLRLDHRRLRHRLRRGAGDRRTARHAGAPRALLCGGRAGGGQFSLRTRLLPRDAAARAATPARSRPARPAGRIARHRPRRIGAAAGGRLFLLAARQHGLPDHLVLLRDRELRLVERDDRCVAGAVGQPHGAGAVPAGRACGDTVR